MITSNRIGALDIASAISERIGSYIDMYSIEFLAADASRILCWYQSPADSGPVFGIELTQCSEGWRLNLPEHPPGTEQQIEVP